MPLHLLVKWEVVSPNSREGQLQSISIISSIPLFWFCISNVGGGCNVFLTFYAISNISRKKFWEYKIIISHLMFSSCFFLYAGNIVKCPVTYSYWLNGRWFLQIVDIGNFIMSLEILKSSPSLTAWLNGRWFLQIVDIHVGNFDMKLTGRWFPQIVDRDSGNLYPIYI